MLKWSDTVFSALAGSDYLVIPRTLPNDSRRSHVIDKETERGDEPEVSELSQPAGAGVGFARSLAKLLLNGRQMTLVRRLL